MSNAPIDNPRTPVIIFIMAIVFIAGYQIKNPNAGVLAIPLGDTHETHR